MDMGDGLSRLKLRSNIFVGEPKCDWRWCNLSQSSIRIFQAGLKTSVGVAEKSSVEFFSLLVLLPMMWLGSMEKPEVQVKSTVSNQHTARAESSEPRMAQGQQGLSIDPPMDRSLTMTVLSFSTAKESTRGPASVDQGPGSAYLEVIVEAP